MPLWLFWFLLGVGLIAFETLVAFTMYAGAVALGAFPAALVAALDASLEVQVAVFAVGSALSLAFVRPLARRHLLTPQKIRTGTDSLIGARATVSRTVDDDAGEVKIRGGDVWSARSLDPGASYEEGTAVWVHEVRGVAVIVDAGGPPELEPAGEPV